MTTQTPERCGSCGARTSPGAAWCSLCHAPVGSAPEPGQPDGSPVRTAAEGSPPEGSPPVGKPQGSPPEASTAVGGAGRRDAAAAEAAAEAEAEAERLLAELGVASAQQRPLGTGPLAHLSRSALVALGVALAVVLSAAVVGLLWLGGVAL